MPRTTRAATRAQGTDATPQVVFEDADATTPPAAEETSQPTTASTRPIFGELTGNRIPAMEPQEQTVTIYAMPPKKIKGKKGRPATKRNKFNLKIQTKNDNDATTEVLQDENQSDTSDAAEAAAAELRRDERPSQTFQVPMDVERARTPPSAAATEATSALLRSPNNAVVAMQDLHPSTAKFNPAVDDETLQAAQAEKEDSFVGEITSRSPAKAAQQAEEYNKDSFIEAIITRSPAKAAPRIEDSVAEMDALDDAIEKVAEILPVLEEKDLKSPTASRESADDAPVPNPKRKAALSTDLATKTVTRPATKALKIRPLPNTTSKRPPTSQPSTMRVKHTSRASVIPSQHRAASVDTSSSSLDRCGMPVSTSPIKVEPNTTQRIRKNSTTTSLSTSKPGFVPAKSTKPPTKSSFTLPGEMIAAKLKAQREERQKREEEAAAKEGGKKVVQKPTTAFKARARLSSVTAPTIKPRETKTSQARQSLMAGNIEKRSASGSRNQGNVAQVTAQQTTKSPPAKAKELAIRKRPSNTGVTTSNSGVKTCIKAKVAQARDSTSVEPNSAVRRTATSTTPGTAQKVSLVPSLSSASDTSAKKSITNKVDPVSQKGKEVFDRGKLQKAEMEKARREKEEAAKKARAEAAERGRMASREWAEKQRKKAAGAKKERTSAVSGGSVGA